MAIFDNPLENVTMTQPVQAPQPTSSLAGDVLQAAQFGLGLWNKVQTQERQQDTAQAVSQASALSLSRMEQFAELRDQKGRVSAMRFARENYLNDLQAIRDPSARKAYIDSFKAVFGGSPVDMENDAQAKVAEAEMKRQQDLLAQGRELVLGNGANPNNFSDAQLARMAESFQGRNAILAQQATELSVRAQQGQIQQQEVNINTSVGMRAFAGAFDQAASTQIMQLHGVYKSGKFTTVNEKGEEVVLTGEEAIRAAENQAKAFITEASATLDTRVRNAVREAGGDPTKVKASDVQMYQDQIDNITGLLTGEQLRKVSEGQLETLMSSASLEAMRGMPKFAQQAAVAKLTGAPVSIAPTAGQIAADTVFSPSTSNPIADLYRGVTETVKMGPAGASADETDPNGAMKSNMDTVMRTLNTVNLDEPQSLEGAARMLYTTFQNGVSDDPNVSGLANGKNGVILLHKDLAQNPEKASKLAPALQAEAERRGTTVDQLMQSQFNRFNRQTLIPSLGLQGLRFPNDAKAGDVISVENVGGKVQFNMDRNFFNPNTPAVQVFQTGTRVDQLTQFNSRLQKAAKDLNTMIKSYVNLTGADPNEVAQAAVEQYQEAMGITSDVE